MDSDDLTKLLGENPKMMNAYMEQKRKEWASGADAEKRARRKTQAELDEAKKRIGALEKKLAGMAIGTGSSTSDDGASSSVASSSSAGSSSSSEPPAKRRRPRR